MKEIGYKHKHTHTHTHTHTVCFLHAHGAESQGGCSEMELLCCCCSLYAACYDTLSNEILGGTCSRKGTRTTTQSSGRLGALLSINIPYATLREKGCQTMSWFSEDKDKALQYREQTSDIIQLMEDVSSRAIYCTAALNIYLKQ